MHSAYSTTDLNGWHTKVKWDKNGGYNSTVVNLFTVSQNNITRLGQTKDGDEAAAEAATGYRWVVESHGVCTHCSVKIVKMAIMVNGGGGTVTILQ